MKDKNVFRDDLESGIPPCFTAAPWPTEHRAYRILEEFWVENIHIEDPEVQDVTLVRRYLEALFQSGMISESDFILLAEFLDTFYTACWHYHNDGRSKQVSFWNQIVGDKS